MYGDDIDFGGHLKDILYDRNIMYKDFAEKCGITPINITRYISNTRSPKLTTVCKMADVLNMTIDDLLLYKSQRSVYDRLPYKSEVIGIMDKSKSKLLPIRCEACKEVIQVSKSIIKKQTYLEENISSGIFDHGYFECPICRHKNIIFKM